MQLQEEGEGGCAGVKKTCHMERLQGYLKAVDWISKMGSLDAVHSGSARQVLYVE